MSTLAAAATTGLSPELKALIARLQADPDSTRALVKRRPDAMVTPGLEVARALIVPRAQGSSSESLIDRIPGGWWTVGLLSLIGAVAIARGSR